MSSFSERSCSHSSQHCRSITSVLRSHAERNLHRTATPFFLSEGENVLLGALEPKARRWMMPPSVDVSREKL